MNENLYTDNVECLICHKKFRFVNNTHLKRHGYTIDEYLLEFPGAKLKSESCNYETGKSLRGQTYESAYGIEAANDLKRIRKISAHKQYEDPRQRQIRSEIVWTDERRRNISIKTSLNRNDPNKKEKWDAAIRNAMYNTGSFPIIQSKAALKWIYNYLSENNIEISNCYFHDDGITDKEYYQQIFNPIINRHQCGSYDLTILGSDGKIDKIIEIHGPWHWKLDEVIVDPNGKSCPLKTNKYTKLESYNKDILKLNHALTISRQVFVYWLYEKQMIEITEPIKLL